jgi:hypothetical protein
MDRLSTPSDRTQAAHTRMLADAATDERVRALLVSMTEMWTKLAEETERLQRIKLHGDQ